MKFSFSSLFSRVLPPFFLVAICFLILHHLHESEVNSTLDKFRIAQEEKLQNVGLNMKSGLDWLSRDSYF